MRFPDLQAGAQKAVVLVALQVSERTDGAMHTSHLGLVPPKLNEEQSQLLWLWPRFKVGRPTGQ